MFASAAVALNNPQPHPAENIQQHPSKTPANRTQSTSNMNGFGSSGEGAIHGGGNTNLLDPNNMPSHQASMARSKSEEVIEALRSGEPGAADKLMSKEPPKGNDGFLKRLKQKMGGGLKGEKTANGSDSEKKNELTKGTSLDDDYSVMTSDGVFSKDGGKGDGVIR